MTKDNTYSSPEDEKFYGAIGRLTISWAHLETGLDGLVDISHHFLGGDQIEAEIPRALSRKITYARKVFKSLPIPQDAIDGYVALIDEIDRAAGTRHDIIHGIVVAQEQGSGVAKMYRALRKLNGQPEPDYTMTTADILHAAIQAQKLGGKLFKWVLWFYEFLGEQSKQGDEQKA